MKTAAQQIGAYKLLSENKPTAYDEAILLSIIEEAELRAEQRVRAEIARDSERLDWLEGIAPDISMVGDGWGNRDHWHLVFADISKGVPVECTGDTIRQAIDAAREVG